LGMGDVETLIEKAEAAYEGEEAEEAARRLMDGRFTLEDFLEQMQALKKMGPLGNLMSMMPGLPKEARDVEIGDDQIGRIEAIIRSMTPGERTLPEVIDSSRRNRIASGSGSSPSEVKQLLDQFKQMQKMMKQMGGIGTKSMKRRTKKRGKKKGGRTTEKGPAKIPKSVLALPGLDELEQD
ncbi:MAG: signal recognition particle protein, partial [Acidobacteria bacterium]|nr:signal recognition particle protein [Acidobacteriota bacterium]